ncbi:PH domain-containing protein [Riemerella columbipharyngis]|uniref:PH domain-containing protein n=1 Tax=Riemerella columbipharyngis TaxID=1071918 RepID=A0A1G6ZDD4_9FLAO|nr:PH domain-containing protein [Riemerella columbipharyngis]SDE00600.1 PH domain-containing protein [Riemerella columbipharyngis]
MNNTIYQAKIHWTSYIIPSIKFVIGFIAAIIGINYWSIPFVLLSLIGLRDYLENYFTDITLMNTKTLTIKQGIISTYINDITLNRLESIEVYQSLLGKIFGYGYLKITNLGVSTIYKISDPLKFRKEILDNK